MPKRNVMLFGIALTALALAFWLCDSAFGWAGQGRLAKMTASTGFLITAIGAGAAFCPYGRVLFVGLVMSWFGDLFLSFSGPTMFQAGVVAFVLGHLAYSIGFATYYVHLGRSAAILALLVIPGALLLAWIWPGVQPVLRPAVVVYMLIISIMVAMAATTLGQPGGRLIFGGALLFYISDIFVARGEFVTSDFYNMLIGMPLYYGGQTLLAASIAVACRDVVSPGPDG